MELPNSTGTVSRDAFIEPDLPKLVKGLAELIEAHDNKFFGGGDLIADKHGNKYIVLRNDKVWNEYPHLVANQRNGKVMAFSSLTFPVTVDIW